MPNVAEFFAADGPFSKIVPGYRPRLGQVDMALAVERAYWPKTSERHELIVEGPTGTGKSLAYLAPAALRALEGGSRTVVVTANIALQEQLVQKDLPALNEALGGRLRYGMLKGRQNYLCLDRYERVERENPNLVTEIRPWARETKTGDKSELSFVPEARVWSEISTDAEGCKGRRCKRYRDCYSTIARAETKTAHIIVTNYHFLFADAKIGHGVIPPYGALIMDEAHKAADIARDFFGGVVREGTAAYLGRLANRYGGELKRLSDVVQLESAAYFGKLKRLKETTYSRRFRAPGQAPGEEYAAALLALADAFAARAEAQAADPDSAAELGTLEKQARKAHFVVQEAFDLADSDGCVYFLDEDERKRLSIVQRRIDVTEILRSSVYEGLSTLVATSATLTTEDPKKPEAYTWIAGELGMKPAEAIGVDSPFDFRANVAMVFPTGSPDPGEKSYPDHVARVVVDVVRRARGRTLGLFTSYRVLKVAAEQLRGARLGYTVHVQGEAPRTRQVAAFRDEVSSVLLGTESFWAGVDVRGEALSCLVIDRLPFPSPDDPVLDAVSERLRNERWDKGAFMTWSVPRAIIAFKQGFGRLIRSEDDRGVVVVIDPRIIDKGYGKKFLRALPQPGVFSTDLSTVGTFLDGQLARGA